MPIPVTLIVDRAVTSPVLPPATGEIGCLLDDAQNQRPLAFQLGYETRRI